MRVTDGCVYAPGVGYYQTAQRRDGGVRIVIIQPYNKVAGCLSVCLIVCTEGSR